jgi:hypothetical protein
MVKSSILEHGKTFFPRVQPRLMGADEISWQQWTQMSFATGWFFTWDWSRC